MRRLPHILLALAVAATARAGGSAMAAGDGASASRVKAAFVCSFTQFVDWPADARPTGDAAFVLGVLCGGGDDGGGGGGGRGAGNDDDAFCDVLTQLAAGKTAAGGHAIAVKRVTTADDAAACHAVYVPASQDGRVRAVFDAVGGKAVLTVGDTDAFVAAGGAVRFVPAGNRVRFEVHTPAVGKARLKVSSKLMKLAIVVDH